MDRNPLQAVATIKVAKLNQMVGIAKICIIEMVFILSRSSSSDFSGSFAESGIRSSFKCNSQIGISKVKVSSTYINLLP